MKKYLMMIIAAIFLLNFSSAYEFGTMTYDTEELNNGNKTFSFALFNMGDENLSVNIETENSDNTSIYFQDKDLILEPNRISSNPSEGWLSIGPNRYVKPRIIQFNAYNPKIFEENSFQIRVEASLAEEEDSNGIEQNAVQVRTLDYILLPVESEERPEVDRGYDTPNDQDQDVVVVENKSELSDEKENSSISENVSRIFLNSSDIGESSVEDERDEKDSIEVTTVFLLASVLISLTYLWRIL